MVLLKLETMSQCSIMAVNLNTKKRLVEADTGQVQKVIM
jgi:hypothetical protein